jgi:hypothetical protein
MRPSNEQRVFSVRAWGGVEEGGGRRVLNQVIREKIILLEK